MDTGHFMIFLSLRFYVKSVLEDLEVVKLPFFAIFGALIFVNLVDFRHRKVQKYIEIQIQSLQNCENARFCTSRISKIDFT